MEIYEPVKKEVSAWYWELLEADDATAGISEHPWVDDLPSLESQDIPWQVSFTTLYAVVK